LTRLAALLAERQDEIIAANQKDVAAYKGVDASMLNRLKVNESKVKGMVSAVLQAVKLPDPENKILYTFTPSNGLRIENRSVPFGKILIIYESRPDVTIEAAITAFKAGNRILLKGGKEAINTNLVLVDIWHKALISNELSIEWVTYLSLNRQQTQSLIKENNHRVDLIIPRGGEGLINFVKSNTNIPVIVSGRGNNFLFVDNESDFEMAISIILNGKSRISVCNALDKVLLHEDLPDLETKTAQLIAALAAKNIEIVVDANLIAQYPQLTGMSGKEIWEEEFLAPKILLSIVKNQSEATTLINQYSGGHSATIITENTENAEQFLRETDCAAVYHNASTRFTDGGEFGFGAEIAISTQKLHFRGPIGINQLVTNKWFIYGTGQVR